MVRLILQWIFKMKRYLSLSFLLHTTILCAVFLPVYFHHQPIGNSQIIKINFQTNAFLFEKQKTIHQTKHGYQLKTANNESNLLNQNISGRESKLLFYLHDAIQKNLLLLNTAANINVQLDVTLAFTVLPNGEIIDAHLIKSTGNPQIDSNILKTVQLIRSIPKNLLTEKPLNLRIHVKTMN